MREFSLVPIVVLLVDKFVGNSVLIGARGSQQQARDAKPAHGRSEKSDGGRSNASNEQHQDHQM
jgi:hypothetical protein